MDLSPRLSALINRALHFPITEIVAPAGFGKSTILERLAEAEGFAVGRIRPDRDANFALIRALCESVQHVAPDIQRGLPAAYANASSTGFADLVPWFWDWIPRAGFRVAIDDLHHLGEDASVFELLRQFIESSVGYGTMWFLCSRTWSRLPTVEWVASGLEGPCLKESDLAFQRDDVHFVAAQFGIPIARDVADDILNVSHGWPLLCSFALRMALHGVQPSRFEDVLKTQGLEAFADRILDRIDPSDTGLLLTIALYDGASSVQLEAANVGNSKRIAHLVASGVPLIQGFDGRWRLHDIVRDRLRIRGAGKLLEEAQSLISKLVVSKKFDEALRVAINSRCAEQVHYLLKMYVRHFADTTDLQSLDEALCLFDSEIVACDWTLCLLRGIVQMRNGHHVESVAYLRLAADLAHGSEKTYATARLAQGLFNCEGHAAEAVTTAQRADALLRPSSREEACEVLGIAAYSYAIAGDFRKADVGISQALEMVSGVQDHVVETKVYIRAAQVASIGSRMSAAEEYIRHAIVIGEREHLFDLLLFCYSELTQFVAADREAEALWASKKSAYMATKTLNKMAAYYADASLYSFAVRSGDSHSLKALRPRMLPVPLARRQRVGCVVLMIAALDAMLQKRYDLSAEYLSQVEVFGESIIDDPLIAPRQATYECYRLLLCQLTNDNHGAVKAASGVLECLKDLRLEGRAISAYPEVEIAKICAGAILGLNGRAAEANFILEDMHRNAHELYRRDLAAWVSRLLVDPTADPSEEAKTRAGGIIELLRRCAANVQAVSLTRAEQRVLELLAEGHPTKEIAAQLQRSSSTVANQITSILRKLNVQNRGEAVARARKAGLLREETREVVSV